VEPALVEACSTVVVLLEGQALTFGRSRDCTVCLDPDDIAISRVAGTIECERGVWWIVNNSTTRPLALVDDLGFRSVLPPQRRSALVNITQVIVDGTKGQHSVRVSATSALGCAVAASDGSDTSTAFGVEVMISDADRLAMVALFAGYLRDPPDYDPFPKSYAAAAARLGWKRTTLVKRIEHLRLRLDAAGVPNMMGFSALHGLAEYAISRGLVTRADLDLLVTTPCRPSK